MGERLTEREVFGQPGWGHQVRYRFASSFASFGDTVLDAACGIGYGRTFFDSSVQYIGVDKEDHEAGFVDEFIQADLNTWEPDFDFNLAVSFETIEHVQDYKFLISQLKKSTRWIITSVPVVPTVHMNEWHLHDFTPLELPGYIEDDNWEMMQYLAQPQELSEIYVFHRKGTEF